MRVALEERRARLLDERQAAERAALRQRFLEEVVWPRISASVRGKRICKNEREAVLGYGQDVGSSTALP